MCVAIPRWQKLYGFTDDQSLLLMPWPGWQPPDHHPRRCHGKKRGTNPPVRCGKPAVKGYDYCISHCSSLRNVNRRKAGWMYRSRAVRGYYSRGAGVALKERLAELAGDEPARRHSLAEEVDLARIGCEKAVRLFEAACMGEEKASPDAQAAALALLRQSLDHVAELVAKASKARRDSLETVDLEQLDYMVDQVVMILEEEVRPLGDAVVDRCTARLKSVKIPERRGAQGVDKAAIARMFRDAAGAIDESVTGGASAEVS
jgi:hypothetical protein